jgi:hypothetical protein
VIRSFTNFVLLVGFTLMLPLFCGAAWLWGSADERLLMKIAFCALSPLCACVWYVLISRLVFYRPASYLVQFLIVIFGYCMIVVLIKSRMVTF